MSDELCEKEINSTYFSCYEDRFNDTGNLFYVVNRKDDFNKDGEFFESLILAKRYISEQSQKIILSKT